MAKLWHAGFSYCQGHFIAAMFGPLFWACFRGHDEAGLLAFEALQGLPRLARGTRTKRGARGLESIIPSEIVPEGLSPMLLEA